MRPYHVLKIAGGLLFAVMMLLARVGTDDLALFFGYFVFMVVGAGLFWLGDRVEKAERARR